MPKFSYQCPACLYITSVVVPRRLDKVPLCASCGEPTQKLIGSPSVVIKGAAYRNNYYVAPTNSELGLPTEHELMKNALKDKNDFVDPNERDAKIDFDAEIRQQKNEVRRKAEKVKETNPQLYDAFRKAQERLKEKKKHGK